MFNIQKDNFHVKKLKEFRIERKIDKEVKLTETKYSEEEKKKYNMLTLDTIFRTYFRILKTNQDSPLIPMVLEGMSLHTYKINFDFMLDIIKLLQNLIETRSNRLQPIDTVRVCYTIFNTLKLQKFLVTIDNIQFYESMYRVLLQIPLFQHIFEEEGNCEKLVECLKVMLLDIKQVPTLRVAAFVKRLMCIILNCNSVISLQLCKLLSLVLRRYYKDFIGMFEQESGNGEYLIDASQPDHSNALNSCFWEFVLLQQHPNPEIQKWVAEIKRLYKR
ncbi:CBF/Mak21 family protein [Entamoeba marina]